MSELLARRAAAVTITLAIMMDLLDTTIVTVAIPTLQREFGADAAMMQWVMTAYLLAIALALPVSAWIGRRLGQKRAFLLAVGLFGLASALTALAWSLPALIVFRAVQGLGGGLILPLGMALLFASFPSDQRAKASALFAVPAALAPAVGPLIGGWLVEGPGWRWIFWINVPLALVVVLIGARALPPQPARAATPLDIWGLLLVAPGLVLLVLGLTGVEGGAPSLAAGVALLGGLCLLAVFSYLQWHCAHPLVDVRLLARRELWSSNLAFMLVAVSSAGFLFLLPQSLQGQRGLGAGDSGALLALHAVGILLATPVSARMTRTRGPKVPLAAGLVVMGLGTGAVGMVGPHAPLWLIGLFILVAGSGFGTTIVPLQTATVTGLTGEDLGQGTTLVNMARQIGMAVGIAVTASVLSLLAPSAATTAPAPAFTAAFLVLAVLALAAVGATVAFRELQETTPEPSAARQPAVHA